MSTRRKLTIGLLAIGTVAVIAATSAYGSAKHVAAPSRVTPTTVRQAPSSTVPKPTTTTIAPTTTTMPTTTTTVSTAGLPGVMSCQIPPFHIKTEIRPSTIGYGCGVGNNNLTGLVWTTWGAASATATATNVYANCVPDCAQGSYSHVPVRVRLSDPGNWNGLFVFQTMTVTPVSGGQPVTTTVGGFGWR
jgi:hypothetical protein